MIRTTYALGLLLAFTVLPVAVSAQTVQNIASRGACSTAGLEGISAQLAEAQMCIRPGAFVRFAPHPGITLSSSRVHPYAQATTRDALHRAASSVGLTINSAFRTLADQYVLYHSGGCGLAAAPGRSNHQSGRAVDVANYSSARSALTAQGCAWLGSSDPVHFDCPGTDRRPDSILAFQRLWNANNPGDRIAEDGLYGPQTESRLGRSPAAGFARGLCDPPPVANQLVGVVYAGMDTDARIEGASVRVVGTDHSTTVGADGLWRFELPSGEHTVEASADGYVTNRRTCTLMSGETWCSVSLMRAAETGTARGIVFEDGGGADGDMSVRLAGAMVVVAETDTMLTADDMGAWSTMLPPGSYTVAASMDGYASAMRSCEVRAGSATDCPLGLAPVDTAGSLEGYVFIEGDPSQRVIGALVEVAETGASMRTREGDGGFGFELAAGAYEINVSGEGLTDASRRCEIEAGLVTSCEIAVVVDGELGPDTHIEMRDMRPSDGEPSLDEHRLEGGCSTMGRDALPLWWAILGLWVVARRRRH